MYWIDCLYLLCTATLTTKNSQIPEEERKISWLLCRRCCWNFIRIWWYVLFVWMFLISYRCCICDRCVIYSKSSSGIKTQITCSDLGFFWIRTYGLLFMLRMWDKTITTPVPAPPESPELCWFLNDALALRACCFGTFICLIVSPY